MSVDRPGCVRWRAAQAAGLVAFGAGSLLPGGGFGWLDSRGRLDPPRPRPLWITARMTHVFALAALAGAQGAGELAKSGVDSLLGEYADPDAGGWFAALDADGRPADTSKGNYEHAFVLLAGSSAVAAGIVGGQELFATAAQAIEQWFWRDDENRSVETWDRRFRQLELYRGANSNMHSVEAYLAAADVSGNHVWRQRALAITTALIDGDARAHGWRLPEHYDSVWRPLLDYNRDRPDDPFRPFGATPGHSLEWSRLLVSLDAALPDSPDWLMDAAINLFDTAIVDGWQPDGSPGFVYTVDWNGQVMTNTRMHWVIAEAVLAADALFRRTSERRFREVAFSWWQEIEDHFIDREHGSWHHELDAAMRPSETTWAGKPDIYHAYQAVVFPSLPLSPSAATSLRGGNL